MGKTLNHDEPSLYYTFHSTPFGKSLIACTEKALVYIALRPSETKPLEKFKRFGYQPIQQENKVIQKVKKQLDEYFAGKLKRFTVPVKLHGTDFQNKVWNLLAEMPFGKMVSYGELAAMANHPRAARAVGSAMAKNQIPIIIPCHRVIPTSRKLGNYTGGVDIKEQLLKLEGIQY